MILTLNFKSLNFNGYSQDTFFVMNSTANNIRSVKFEHTNSRKFNVFEKIGSIKEYENIKGDLKKRLFVEFHPYKFIV